MQYTAIIKDGGLFIPNVFADLNDGSSHIVQVEMDMEEVREQLPQEALQETVPKAVPKTATAKTATAKTEQLKVTTPKAVAAPKPKTTFEELEALDDGELSEIFKAYVNDGQIPLGDL